MCAQAVGTLAPCTGSVERHGGVPRALGRFIALFGSTLSPCGCTLYDTAGVSVSVSGPLVRRVLILYTVSEPESRVPSGRFRRARRIARLYSLCEGPNSDPSVRARPLASVHTHPSACHVLAADQARLWHVCAGCGHVGAMHRQRGAARRRPARMYLLCRFFHATLSLCGCTLYIGRGECVRVRTISTMCSYTIDGLGTRVSCTLGPIPARATHRAVVFPVLRVDPRPTSARENHKN